MQTAMHPLERELETYKRELHALLPDEGKFVLIFDQNVVGIYEAYSDALQIGYEKFGVKPFLVKQISATEQLSYFTRDLRFKCQA